MSDGVRPIQFHRFDDGWQPVDGEIIEETLISIFVNGDELATIMATPRDQAQLALGFLLNEEIIGGLADVRAVHPCPSGLCVDVWLARADVELPRRAILTSGCGGGVTFDDLSQTRAPLQSAVISTGARIAELINGLQQRGGLYARARGVHTSALSDGEQIVVVAEDVGRHNTLDKLRGECLLRGLDPRDHILLATGRISSEMIREAATMGCPIVASRTSPTSLSVELAREWNITLCGYVRRGRLNVYSHPERLGLPPDEARAVIVPAVDADAAP